MNVKTECMMNDGLPENSVEIGHNRSKDPHSVSNGSKNQNDRPKTKVKYRVKNISNGKFNLAPANGSPVSRKLENIQKSSSVQTGLVMFRKNWQCSLQVQIYTQRLGKGNSCQTKRERGHQLTFVKEKFLTSHRSRISN
eukprot:TRINITY_DN17597_c0_g1_i1.p1 TRINITY_DN17597_c0_g1~~TRINITY_DN17597_c0_g1_i1.p1  ORF type:complete len:139 (-),score=13.72 TRINITY_DN17597_c0_g1_i1:45-461(-)